MKIGIDASRAFQKRRTGIEEYSYQLIKNLRDDLRETEVVLYVRKNQKIDFDLPSQWSVKVIGWPIFWTQLGLSIEMLFHRPEVLLVPAHTVPMIHPRKTIVVIHGLEYEFCPKAYSFWERIYMRKTIRKSCDWSEQIVAVSENTKKDLVSLYGVLEEKIAVIYEGATSDSQEISDVGFSESSPFLLFVGRLEERKNLGGIIEAFQILKEMYDSNLKLILAGKPGYGYEKIRSQIENSRFKKDILELGFVSEKEKNALFRAAEVFLFPSFYEGFGLPILEAQKFRVPVITSNISSMPEVSGGSAVLVDPRNSKEIAEGIWKIISDDHFREDLVEKGIKNIERFSWKKCAQEMADVLVK